ncbi:MAG: helix-turn-helix domain-containing protein [Acidimicrobiales bacterium]
MNVEIVRWPEHAARLAELREVGSARLILVEGSGLPLVTSDPLEDWIRVPTNATDIQLRTETLERRASAAQKDRPEMDDAGLVRFGEDWVALPPVEARIMSSLVAGWGVVVAREELTAAGWPENGIHGRNALDVHITRIRKRLRGTRLALRTVRSKGYLLEAEALT